MNNVKRKLTHPKLGLVWRTCKLCGLNTVGELELLE